MSDDALTHSQDAEWANLPRALKERARILLLALNGAQLAHGEPDLLAEVRAMYAEGPTAWPPPGFYCAGGMAVRHYLRSAGFPDNALPTGRWDDYYLAALEYAAGVRTE